MPRYYPSRLNTYSYEVASTGNKKLARRLLREYAVGKGWSDETLRARWDGATALLNWWREFPKVMRPPLNHLTQDEARAFLTSLERKGLARSTIKSYRVGADAMTRAVRWAWTLPVGDDPDYRPFHGVQPRPKPRPVPKLDRAKLEALPHDLRRTKLEVLLALLELGLSVPDACLRTWGMVDLHWRTLNGPGGRQKTLGVPAVEALEALWHEQAKYRRNHYYTVLGWSPDTARKWLKKVRG